jgi:hypothetical protein
VLRRHASIDIFRIFFRRSAEPEAHSERGQFTFFFLKAVGSKSPPQNPPPSSLRRGFVWPNCTPAFSKSYFTSRVCIAEGILSSFCGYFWLGSKRSCRHTKWPAERHWVWNAAWSSTLSTRHRTNHLNAEDACRWPSHPPLLLPNNTTPTLLPSQKSPRNWQAVGSCQNAFICKHWRNERHPPFKRWKTHYNRNLRCEIC